MSTKLYADIEFDGLAIAIDDHGVSSKPNLSKS